MASVISTKTSEGGGIAVTGDTSGIMQLASNNGTTAVTIDASQNVGIGTASPAVKLDVNGGGSFTGNIVSIAPSTTGIHIGKDAANTINCGVDIVAGTNGFAWLDFTNTGTDWKGRVGYNTSTNAMSFDTNSTSKMIIDSNGNLQFNSGYGSVATAYGCRAWVNFNGTGTIAINASGNVTSITDNGVGDYTANFTVAMPDANYCATGSTGATGGSLYRGPDGTITITTSQFRFRTTNGNGGSYADPNYVYVAFFR